MPEEDSVPGWRPSRSPHVALQERTLPHRLTRPACSSATRPRWATGARHLRRCKVRRHPQPAPGPGPAPRVQGKGAAGNPPHTRGFGGHVGAEPTLPAMQGVPPQVGGYSHPDACFSSSSLWRSPAYVAVLFAADRQGAGCSRHPQRVWHPPRRQAAHRQHDLLAGGWAGGRLQGCSRRVAASGAECGRQACKRAE